MLHTAMRCTKLAHLHGNVSLFDREQLKGGVGAFARLGEAIHLHCQELALRMPEELDLCMHHSSLGMDPVWAARVLTSAILPKGCATPADLTL